MRSEDCRGGAPDFESEMKKKLINFRSFYKMAKEKLREEMGQILVKMLTNTGINFGRGPGGRVWSPCHPDVHRGPVGTMPGPVGLPKVSPFSTV